MIFFQIDCTLGDRHPADVGRMHVLFRRENPTTQKKDFELLPKRTGKGRFLGAVVGVVVAGFFLIPADPDGNNTRVFVMNSAVVEVRWL